MKAIILAAGYATRLWPLTLNRPKPLLPVGSKAMVDHIVEKMAPIKEIDEIFVVTNSKFVKNFKAWKKNHAARRRVSIVDDGMKKLEERRGSIGDTIFAVESRKIRSDVIVVAGDNIFDFEIDGFIKSSKKNSPYATIGLFDINEIKLASKYGIVGLDKNKVIKSFEEKPKRPMSTLAAMCLYYFPKEKLRLLKSYRDEGNSLDLAGSFIRWLSRNEKVYGYTFEGTWLDIGDKKSLKEAQAMKWD